MTDQDKQEIRGIIAEALQDFKLTDRYAFQKLIQIFDGRNVQLGIGTGTKFGTASTQKIGFLGATPVVQQATIADADGTLADATTKINAILDVLDIFGFTA